MSITDGQPNNQARMRRVQASIPASYTIFKSGSTYYAECMRPGGTDYNDNDPTSALRTVLQAAIDVVEAAPPGKIFLNGMGQSWDLDATITVQESNIHLWGDNVLINYSGAAQAFVLGTAAARKNNMGLHHVRVAGTASGTVGVEALECDQTILENIGVTGFTAGDGIKVNGGATWASVNSIYEALIGNCSKAIDFAATTHGNRIFGGYLYRSAVGTGTKGIYLSADSDYVRAYGAYIEAFVNGVEVDGEESSFNDLTLEDCTTGIIYNAGAFNCVALNPIFINCGTSYTNNGTANSNAMLGPDYGFQLPKTRRLNAVAGTNLDLALTTADGSTAIRVFDSGDNTVCDIDSDGEIKVYSAAKGVILTNAAGTVTKRCRLNDAGDGWIFENP